MLARTRTVLLLLLPLSVGCTVETRSDRFAVANSHRLEQVVRIKVDGSHLRYFEDPAQLPAAVVQHLQNDFDLASVVWLDEPGGDEGPDPDAFLEIKIEDKAKDAERKEESLGDPKLDLSAAFLQLGLPTIPVGVTGWWLPYVEVDTGIRVDAQFRPVGCVAPGGGDPRPTTVREAVILPTSFLERYDFVSWETLGSIFLSPLPFQNSDTDRFVETIRKRLAFEVAYAIAENLKNLPRSREALIRDVEFDVDGSVRILDPSKDLWKIEVELESQESVKARKVFRFPLDYTPSPVSTPLALDDLLDEAEAGDLVRVRVCGRRGGIERYTLLVPVAIEQEV